MAFERVNLCTACRNEGGPPTPMMHLGQLYVMAATYLGGRSVSLDTNTYPLLYCAAPVPTPILAELNAQLQSH
jgi:hypothetical protein